MSLEPQRLNRPMLWRVLALALLVWAVYWTGLKNPFEFDDWHVIPQNPEVRGPADVPEFFTDVSKFSILPGNRDYRPLFLTSMALSWWVGGGSTLPFHLVSVSLHMGCVLLIFVILRRLLSRESAPSGGLEAEIAEQAALLAAALFAVHPLATEAVVYISSQSIPLTAFFYLLALGLFLSANADPGAPARRWPLRIGSWLAYSLALLSKPIAVTFPIVLALWDLLFGAAAAETPGAKQRWRLLWQRVRKHVPFALLTLLYLAVRGIVAGNPLKAVAVVASPDRSLFVHYLTQTKALVLYYLRLALFPVGQSVDREYPVSQSILDGGVLLALAIIVAAGWLAWRFRRQRALVFWSLWFPVCFLVESYVVRLGQEVREARVYLPLVGVCAVAGFLAFKALEALPIHASDTVIGRKSGRVVARVAMVGVLFMLGMATVARNEVWSSSLTLWGDAVRNEGTWRAHMNYALALEDEGRADEALTEFKRAVELGPYAWSHLNLGLAYLRRGNQKDSLDHLQYAVRLWPDSADTHYYLGRGLETMGREREAEQEFKQALALRENYILACERLARLYERQGRNDLALGYYERLLEIDRSAVWAQERIAQLREAGATPAGRSDELFLRGFSLQRQGQVDAAIAAYEELLALSPNHRQGLFNLAYAYLYLDTEEAWQRSADLFSRVLEVDPGYTEALFHLATVYWKLNRTDEARQADRRFLEVGVHEDLKQRSKERLESTQ